MRRQTKLSLSILLLLHVDGFITVLPLARSRLTVQSYANTDDITKLSDADDAPKGIDQSMVAATSASTLRSISGDSPILQSWCEEATEWEIPQFLDDEKDMLSDVETEAFEEEDEDMLLWKTLPYTNEMVEELWKKGAHSSTTDISKKDALCVIDEAFDTTAISKKRRNTRHKHLFRYSPDISVACWLATVEPTELLRSCGYTLGEIERLSIEYPKVLSMNAKDLVAPKLRFLVNVLGGGNGDIGNGLTLESEQQSAQSSEGQKAFIPHNLIVSDHVRRDLPTAAFFSARLETSVAPRHAYLAFHRSTLPYGKELLERGDDNETMPLLRQFLSVCTETPEAFASLCNEWQHSNVAKRPTDMVTVKTHTAESVEAMDNIFCDGLSPFARNEATPDLEVLDERCTPADIVSLLLDHGANYAEHDDWGSTVLHWAAGTGNIDGTKAIIQRLEMDEVAMGGDVKDVLWSTCASCSITKDGATPLHWSAAGVNRTQFGCGGERSVLILKNLVL
eukprot:scaffold367_cov202-Alexandrium_tamarense.AAC.35